MARELMTSNTSKIGISEANSNFRERILRFKWAGLSAILVFVGIYSVHFWLSQHGFRREARVADDILVALLVFILLVIQQLRHERQLRRRAEIMRIIADMNHHTRNALQVIVDQACELGKPFLAPEAIEDIWTAVKRIEWCLSEILPKADESTGKRPAVPEHQRHESLARSNKSAG